MRSSAILLVLLVGCPPGPVGHRRWECVWEGEARPEHLFQVGCEADFDALAGEPLTPFFGNTDSVKWVIDLHEGNLTYFFDSARWRLHYDFCLATLDRPDDRIPSHSAFNQREYFSEDRRFLLGTIEHYRALDVYAIEFAAGDEITNAQIVEAYRAVARQAYFGEALKFRPVSRAQDERTRDLDIPRIGYDEIFEGQTYQPLQSGETYGWIRIVRDGGLEDAGLGARDIAVLGSVPNDIAVVAGLVTSEFQAPLSHVNVLSHTRGTPNMALVGAQADDRFAENADQLVHLVVDAQDFVVEPATLEEAEPFWEARRPSTPFAPPFDTTVRELQDAEDVGVDDVARVGAKAANFGELTAIVLVAPYVPEGFAIPVVWYLEHVERAGLSGEIEDMLSDEQFATDLATRRERLAALRDAIEAAPVDPELVGELQEKIADKYEDNPPLRFRSSSNAEDLAGFSGAGLYTSRTGQVGDQGDPIEDAIRAVWASLWNDRAYEERDYYRIVHASCAMGILVHPSHPDEAVNGVAITTNPFSRGRPAYFVNSQLGEVSVVDSSAIPEQLLYYTWYPEPQIEYLSRSSLTDGDVLGQGELADVADALGSIHDHFFPLYAGVGTDLYNFGMDVEFKLDGDDRHLVIKQARPYYVDPVGL